MLRNIITFTRRCLFFPVQVKGYLKIQEPTVSYKKTDNFTWVVFSKDRPSTPEVSCKTPDFWTIASVVCFSDPSLKPSINKIPKQISSGTIDGSWSPKKFIRYYAEPPQPHQKLGRLTMFMWLTIDRNAFPWLFHYRYYCSKNLQKSDNKHMHQSNSKQYPK